MSFLNSHGSPLIKQGRTVHKTRVYMLVLHKLQGYSPITTDPAYVPDWYA